MPLRAGTKSGAAAQRRCVALGATLAIRTSPVASATPTSFASAISASSRGRPGARAGTLALLTAGLIVAGFYRSFVLMGLSAGLLLVFATSRRSH